ncbi:hypothetical protein RB195_016292 [Necator americanus]|uniref:Secreted protein n=1 Tax=Necator americanus TaxID=51031 RepID=A0ABR1E8Q4_NECAM
MIRLQILILNLLTLRLHALNGMRETPKEIEARSHENQKEKASLPGFWHFIAFHICIPLLMVELTHYEGPSSNTYLKEAGCSANFGHSLNDHSKMKEIQTRICTGSGRTLETQFSTISSVTVIKFHALSHITRESPTIA